MRGFLLLYFLYISLFFLLVDFKPVREFLQIERVYNIFITALSAKMIEIIQIPVDYDLNILHLANADMVIKFGCNGLEAILIFIAGVLAYPSSFKSKIIGIVIGVLIIEAINILRIAFLAYVINNYPKFFDIMHSYVTQSIMIILAFIIFLFYTQAVEKR
jgi:exosortase family protein XrtM